MIERRARESINRLFLICLGAILNILAIFLEDLYFSILAINVFFGGVLFFSARTGNLLRPDYGFVIFFYLYSTWYIYRLLILGEGDAELMIKSLNFSNFGLLFFIIFSSRLFSFKEVSPGKKFLQSLQKDLTPQRFLYFIFFILLMLTVLEVSFSGARSKSELLEHGLHLKSLSDFFIFPFTAVIVLGYLRSVFVYGVIINKGVVCSIFIILFAYLFSGERDWLFRLLICLGFVYFDAYRSARYFIFLGGVLAVSFLMPLSQAMKAVFISDGFFIEGEGALLIFGGEFISASRNLYYIMANYSDSSLSYFFNDLLRGVTPLGSYLGIQSTANWYNLVFRVEHGFSSSAGWGLGLIAQGYLIGGYWGVALVMSIVGLMLSNFYSLRFRSKYWYVFYVLFLTSAIYSIRGDIASLLSLGFKVGGLGVFIVYFINLIFKRA